MRTLSYLLFAASISTTLVACGGPSRVRPPEFERVWGNGGIEATWLGMPIALEVSTVVTGEGVELAKGCIRVGVLHWCQSPPLHP